MVFWIKEVANIFKDRIGFDYLLLRLSNEDSLEYIRSRMANIEISRFLQPSQHLAMFVTQGRYVADSTTLFSSNNTHNQAFAVSTS